EKNFIDFSLFMVFFPALTSGPVERGDHLIPQLKEADIRKTADAGSFKVGLFRICRGFFLKLCVADNIKVLVDTVYSSPDKFAGVPVIIAVLAYSMQIYCDFAGYSDIAIGSARLFGIRLLENFDAPYLSRSIKDIWRRWHMSLSFWFRDYLYFPLGGSKKGTRRAYLNIMAVFAVSGLWHGADWKFIFWGVLNGMYQVTESIIEKGLGIGKNEKSGTWRIVLNYLLMSLAWIFFRADTMGDAFRIISSIFGTGSQGILSAGSGAPALIVTAVFILVTAAYDVWNRKQDVADTICKTDALWFVCAAVIILVLVFGAYGTGYDSADFIYNRF
nr:MBOAT family protein [Oscillospiraceae bacterium]